jgi:hypothetical protein
LDIAAPDPTFSLLPLLKSVNLQSGVNLSIFAPLQVVNWCFGFCCTHKDERWRTSWLTLVPRLSRSKVKADFTIFLRVVCVDLGKLPIEAVHQMLGLHVPR